MHRTLKPAVAAAAVVLAAISACVNPTERSNQLSIEFPDLPDLFLKDSLQLDARLVDDAGSEIDNGLIDYTSSDPTVVSVDAFGMLLAVGAGTATITADARLYENTDPTAQAVTVRGLLEIDSVRPLQVRFGDVITLYGVGLDPDSLFLVGIGDASAPDLGDFALYVPADPAFPNRLGELTVWVPPPANPISTISVLGFNGVRVHDEDLRVFQFDLYEANDTTARDLGTLPTGFLNPALAFETRRRDELIPLGSDWYQFRNTTVQSRTLVVFATGLNPSDFSVFMSSGLGWSTAQGEFNVSAGSWSVGPGAYFCDALSMTLSGEPFQPLEERFPAAVIALDNLAPGTYNFLTVFQSPGEPQPYEVAIFNQYLSIDGTAKDPAEENDFCSAAKDINAGLGVQLTIDNPHDIDWFKFTVPAGGQSVDIRVASPDTLVDVDLYLVADQRPADLPVVDFSTEFGTNTDRICARDLNGNCTGPLPLLPGDYFLVAFDFAGETGSYTLSAAFTAPPPGIVRAPPVQALDADLRASVIQKRAAKGGAEARSILRSAGQR